MAKTLEEKTAETILQRAAEIKIGEKTYKAASPSIATLILVSEAVSRLPHRKLDKGNMVQESLAVGKDGGILCEIAAILVLGARHINDPVNDPQTGSKHPKWGFFRRKRKAHTLTQKEYLTREIAETYGTKELENLIALLLGQMDLADFFALTTFLTEVNLLRQTKVETKTTAFGQSSQAR